MNLIKEMTIEDEDELFRRIPPEWYVEKEKRISSAAFKDPETSVDWAKLTTPEKSLRKQPSNVRLASIIAKIPRSLDLKVKHSPSKRNKAHSLILGKKTHSKAKHLAQNSKEVKVKYN